MCCFCLILLDAGAVQLCLLSLLLLLLLLLLLSAVIRPAGGCIWPAATLATHRALIGQQQTFYVPDNGPLKTNTKAPIRELCEKAAEMCRAKAGGFIIYQSTLYDIEMD